MANKETLGNGLVKIAAGQPVESFLDDINENFEQVQPINTAQKPIIISNRMPSAAEGVDGDIWIVYEE